jgi:hypothetical protein
LLAPTRAARSGGNAFDLVTTLGDLIVQGPILVSIGDTGFNQINPINFIAGGQIGESAIATLTANNINTSSTASGTPGIDVMALEVSIYSNGSGQIGGDALVNVLAQQGISVLGTAFFTVANGNFMGTGGGSIGGNAEVNVSGTSISTGDLFDQIFNYGGASIGGNALVALTATNLSVKGNLDSRIDNGTGGTIKSGATIDFSVSGNSMIANDAMFQILGSDGAASAAININGGSYSVGKTFLGNIDGSGTFTLNATITAGDAVKIGVFGSNGTLRIGRAGIDSIISANTLLHLYAPGSNGLIDFVANTTLNSSGTAAVIAANTVTIENGVVVTIGGSTPANVYANVPNYSARSGGNGNTTGSFAGAGATRQPLGGQPPFDSPTSARAATRQSRSISSAEGRGPAIYIADSSRLASMLNNAALGPDGKVHVSANERTRKPSMQGSTASTRTAAAELHRSADPRARLAMLTSRLQ